MTKYIIKRVFISVATLVVVLFVLYLMLQFMPGSPFNDEKLTEVQRQLLYTKYGLDKPFLVQFWKYLTCMLKGDFGVSYVINKNFSVFEMTKARLLVSCRVGLQAWILGTVIGLILGLIAALKRNSWIDSFCSILSLFGVSIPSYVFGLLLVYFVAYKMNMFGITYDVKHPFITSILPSISLSFGAIANVARFTRSEMIDVLGSEYMLLAQAKGVKDWKIILRHGLRNAMIPVVTVMGPILVNLLTGSMVIEKIFAIPGIGSLMVLAIQSNDYNVVLSTAFVYSAMYVAVMFIVDILYGVIDPRIRVAKGN